MKKERPPRLRLFDILNEAERCQRWLEGVTEHAFLENDQLQYAVERSLQIVSEASRHIGPEIKSAHPGVDWRALANFGNLSRHGYDEVEIPLIYEIATTRLKPLKVACEQLYADLKRPSDPWPDARET